MRFFCRTCPYVFQLKSKVTSEATLERKVVDDVLGGPDAWKNADQTEGARALPATTTSCHHHRAHLRLPHPARPRFRQPTAASAATTTRTTSSCRSARRTSR